MDGVTPDGATHQVVALTVRAPEGGKTAGEPQHVNECEGLGAGTPSSNWAMAWRITRLTVRQCDCCVPTFASSMRPYLMSGTAGPCAGMYLTLLAFTFFWPMRCTQEHDSTHKLQPSIAHRSGAHSRPVSLRLHVERPTCQQA
jgi:hypothetical protein